MNYKQFILTIDTELIEWLNSLYPEVIIAIYNQQSDIVKAELLPFIKKIICNQKI